MIGRTCTCDHMEASGLTVETDEPSLSTVTGRAHICRFSQLKMLLAGLTLLCDLGTAVVHC